MDIANAIKPYVTGAINWVTDSLHGFFGWVKNAVEGLRGIFVDHDFNEAFAQAFNISESSVIVDFLFTVRDAIVDLWTIISGGDTSKLRELSLPPGLVSAIQGARDAFWDLVSTVRPYVESFFDYIADTGESPLEPFKTLAAVAGQGLATAFQQLFTVTKYLASALGETVGWLRQNWDWISAIVVGVAGAYGAYQLWTGAIKAWGFAVQAWQAIVKVGTAIQAAFNAVMAANPIMLVVMAIAALAAGLTWFFTQTETGRQIWAAFTQFLSDAWQAITDAWTAFADGFAAAWNGFWDGVKAVFTAIWDGITWFFQAQFEVWKTVFMFFVGLFMMGWEALWGWVGPYVTAVWDTLTAGWQVLWDTISAAWTAFSGWLTGIWQAVWGGISSFFTTIWETISSCVSSVLAAVSAVISGTLSAISGVWNSVWSAVSGFFAQIWDSMRGSVQAGIDAVYNTVTSIRDKVTGFFSGAGTWLYNSGKAILQGLVDGIMSAISWITGAFDTVMSKAREYLPFSPAKRGPFSGKGWTLYSGRSIVEGLAQGVNEKSGLFVDALAGTMDAGNGALTGFKTGSYTYRAGSLGGPGFYGNTARELVVRDVNDELVGRMRVEAAGEVGGALAPVSRSRLRELAGI